MSPPFNNNEGVDSGSQASKYEFPIKTDGTLATYNSPVTTVPDRVVFEYTGPANCRLLGVMRRGPQDFFECTVLGGIFWV